jgi:ribosomal protein S18 acetylase RimI-like enzyme
VGKKLLAAMRGESRRRGLPGLLIVCDEASGSGVAFLAAVAARFRSAEYRLELDPAAIDRSRPRHEDLRLRQARIDDAAILARLRAATFGVTEAEAQEQMARRDGPGHRHFLATLGGEPIGMLRTGALEGTADVTAFAVLPEHRGRGYGRQMLLETVDMLLAEGWERIIIEVATDNVGALGLYKSCGFKVATAYGFYDLDA